MSRFMIAIAAIVSVAAASMWLVCAIGKEMSEFPLPEEIAEDFR